MLLMKLANCVLLGTRPSFAKIRNIAKRLEQFNSLCLIHLRIPYNSMAINKRREFGVTRSLV